MANKDFVVKNGLQVNGDIIATGIITGSNGVLGDMSDAIYDPQNISADAFLRSNHTGSGIFDTGETLTITDNPTLATHAANKNYVDNLVPIGVEFTANKNAINGYAGLDANGIINSSQLPLLAITSTFAVASELAQLALTVQEGDVAVRSDLNVSYIALNATNGSISDWQQLLTPTDTVLSVAGKTGAVSLLSTDLTDSATLITTTGGQAINGSLDIDTSLRIGLNNIELAENGAKGLFIQGNDINQVRLDFRTSDSITRGFLLADNFDQIGFLDSNQQWTLRTRTGISVDTLISDSIALTVTPTVSTFSGNLNIGDDISATSASTLNFWDANSSTRRSLQWNNTTNQFELEVDSGVTYPMIHGGGGQTINGQFGFGTNTLSNTYNTSFYNTKTGTSGNAYYQRTAYIDAQGDSSKWTDNVTYPSKNVTGLTISALQRSDISAVDSLSSMIGLAVQYGSYFGSGTSTIDNAYGLQLINYVSEGAVTNSYGLYITEGDVSGNNVNQPYGIYQNGIGLRNFFGGATHFNDTVSILGNLSSNKLTLLSNGEATETDIQLTDNANIAATQNLNFYIDSDNSQTDRSFNWYTNSGATTGATKLMSLQENGQLRAYGSTIIDGDLSIKGDLVHNVISPNDATINLGTVGLDDTTLTPGLYSFANKTNWLGTLPGTGAQSTNSYGFLWQLQDSQQQSQIFLGGTGTTARLAIRRKDNAQWATWTNFLHDRGDQVINGSLIADGIQFPAAQAASADPTTLDDYEEGTWIPAVTFGGLSTGVVGLFDGTYTKIGRQVTVHGSVILSSKGTATGVFNIDGLPFTIGDSMVNTIISASGPMGRVDNVANNIGTIAGLSLTSTCTMYNSNGQQLTDLDFIDTSLFRFSITYIV